MVNIPSEYNLQQDFWKKNAQNIILNYTNQKHSFLVGCQPQLALKMPAVQIIYILSKRFGEEKVRFCLNFENSFPSTIQHQEDTNWLKKVNMVGVNIRTIGSFWNLVKYATTLPSHVSAIHLLPIWECGVVASLYGIASWRINAEFFDGELATQYPHLNTAEKQLKIVVNLLHLMGKSVGFDVVPHTDRYSEISLSNPFYFEWLQRKDFKIVDHSDQLVNKVAQRIIDYVVINGSNSGDYYPRTVEDFFNNQITPEPVRHRILFGDTENAEIRNSNRNKLINFLFLKGYEPVPATMAPPYRGLMVDPAETAKTIDADGRVWRDYLIEKPQEMSRVFGPLARYKLYESKNDNLNWEIDFKKPRKQIFEYVAEKYKLIAEKFNFDFMRGDMSHVQMNPHVIEEDLDVYYDIHKYVKHEIQKGKPYFGYFAESFLVDDNLMAFGNEAQHLNFSDTDTTLGNLQSFSLTDADFYIEFSKYYFLAKQNNFVANFTIFTADKDDPRFDIFYLQGNDCRYFLATFFKFFPSYSSLGFEIRDLHPTPAPNEHYTKLYVFQVPEGPKSTNGPYVWGANGTIFEEISQINLLAESILIENEMIDFQLISKMENFVIDRYLVWKLLVGNKNFLFVTALALLEKNVVIDFSGYENLTLCFGKNMTLLEDKKCQLSPFSYAIFSV